jgi:hypothetical protein
VVAVACLPSEVCEAQEFEDTAAHLDYLEDCARARARAKGERKPEPGWNW